MSSQPLQQKTVFKVATAAEWTRAMERGAYQGSADDIRDGFIHLSLRHQLDGTLAKHFRQRSDLILIAFEAASLGDALKWEVSRGGDRFPHLYAPLPAARALWTRPLTLGEDGVPQLPQDLDR